MGQGKGKEKRMQVAIPDRDSKRPRIDGASSSTSAPLGNGGGLHESREDVNSDNHSVSREPPPPQASDQLIESQGEPPTASSKWKFNLEEAPGGTLALLPPVPPRWEIFQALPSEEELATLPEALFVAMIRCCKEHHMVG